MTSLTFDIYLRSTPERVWAVLTDPGKVPAGRFGMSSHTDWHARHQVPGQTTQDETDSESAAGRRLTCEWLQTEHLTANGGRPSVVSFEFIAMGEVTQLIEALFTKRAAGCGKRVAGRSRTRVG